MSDQVELTSPPLDSISSLDFSPTDPHQLLVGSWDATTRLYDVATNEQKSKFDHRAPILAVSFAESTRAFSGGLDHVVHELDLASERSRVLGSHTNAVSATNWVQDQNFLITGSWDQTLRTWDPRAPTSLVSTYQLPERVYRTSLTGNTLVVALASRLFRIYDVRNLAAGPTQERESSLKFMTRSLACMATGQGFATGSVEGRIAVEYFDASAEAQAQKYAFKCHRQTIDDVDHVWPVNALVFHPIYNTFASAGSDGTLSLWDHNLKKRLRQYPKYPTGISALAFNSDGTRLAIGVSDTWDDGVEPPAGTTATPSIWVRAVSDEVKPKGWAGP